MFVLSLKKTFSKDCEANILLLL